MADIGSCRLCLEEHPLTVEHVFPQSIGGRLKERLLCVECNSGVGAEVDAAVCAQMRSLSVLLKVGRTRGRNPGFRVTQSATGEELDIHPGGVRRARPRVDKPQAGQRDGWDVPARSPEELHDIMSGIARKEGRPLEDYETRIEMTPTGEIEYLLEIGGQLYLRGIAKIAYLFMTMGTPREFYSHEAFDVVRKYILEGSEQRMCGLNYVHTDFLVDDKRPNHAAAVSFSPERRSVVGYVQLFGPCRFSVALTATYPWAIALPPLSYRMLLEDGTEAPLLTTNQVPEISASEAALPNQGTSHVEKSQVEAFKALYKHVKESLQPSFEVQRPGNPSDEGSKK